MEHRSFKTLFSLISILMVLTFSLFSTIPVFADDATPPVPTEEPVQPPTDEPVATEVPVVTEEPVATEPPISTEAPPATEVPAVDSPEESVSLAEVLVQLPPDTTLVVLDESGEALPLVTEEAAATLAAPDPYFTVGGVLYQFTAEDCDPDPVDVLACPNPIQAAIDYLAILDATPDDSAIYVESGTYNEDIQIDGSDWTDLGDLQLVGAGSGSTTINGSLVAGGLINSFTLSGFTFNGPVFLNTFSGDLNVNDVVINGDPESLDAGLAAFSLAGDINIQNTTVRNSGGDGVIAVTGLGDINVLNSQFAGNGSNIGEMPCDSGVCEANTYGLEALSFGGQVLLDTVNVDANYGHGAFLAGTSVFVTNSTFNGNGLFDLSTYAGGEFADYDYYAAGLIAEAGSGPGPLMAPAAAAVELTLSSTVT
ncbi:MAG: hypothetical protein AB1649_31245, partial [Chloroflexota bacterium]